MKQILIFGALAAVLAACTPPEPAPAPAPAPAPEPEPEQEIIPLSIKLPS